MAEEWIELNMTGQLIDPSEDTGGAYLYYNGIPIYDPNSGAYPFSFGAGITDGFVVQLQPVEIQKELVNEGTIARTLNDADFQKLINTGSVILGRQVDVAGDGLDVNGKYYVDSPTSIEIENYVANALEDDTVSYYTHAWVELDVPSASLPLFTTGDDTVDFNALTDDQIAAINGGAELYNSLDGNDTVTLPDIPHYQLMSGVDWDPTNGFTAGNGNDMIQGGDGNDIITLGSGTDIVYGSPGTDVISGGTGADTFDYQDGSYANFSGFASGTVQTIKGNHVTFQTDPTKQNVLELPGSANDYAISTSYNSGDSFFDTSTTFTTNGKDGLTQNISISATGVEQVKFAAPISNPVTPRGGSVAAEMLQLAAASYGSLPSSPKHLSEPLAYTSGDTSLNAAAGA